VALSDAASKEAMLKGVIEMVMRIVGAGIMPDPYVTLANAGTETRRNARNNPVRVFISVARLRFRICSGAGLSVVFPLDMDGH
jgi:hypothetical protein